MDPGCWWVVSWRSMVLTFNHLWLQSHRPSRIHLGTACATLRAQRQKYVDIVTDTLHASSSDLITWNTLVMIKLKWIDIIPRQWLEITTQSLEAWKQRDEKSPFLPDNRRGYARVTPVALSKVGVPNTEIHAMDEFPLHGLGLYDDFEPWGRYSGYVWSGWTTRKAQPVHIDPALRAFPWCYCRYSFPRSYCRYSFQSCYCWHGFQRAHCWTSYALWGCLQSGGGISTRCWHSGISSRGSSRKIQIVLAELGWGVWGELCASLSCNSSFEEASGNSSFEEASGNF